MSISDGHKLTMRWTLCYFLAKSTFIFCNIKYVNLYKYINVHMYLVFVCGGVVLTEVGFESGTAEVI